MGDLFAVQSQIWKGSPIPWIRRHNLAAQWAAHVVIVLLGAAANAAVRSVGRYAFERCATLGYQMRSTPRWPVRT